MELSEKNLVEKKNITVGFEIFPLATMLNCKRFFFLNKFKIPIGNIV